MTAGAITPVFDPRPVLVVLPLGPLPGHDGRVLLTQTRSPETAAKLAAQETAEFGVAHEVVPRSEICWDAATCGCETDRPHRRCFL